MQSPLVASSPGGAGGVVAGGNSTSPDFAGCISPTAVMLTPQQEREHSLQLISRVIHATHDMAPAPAGQNTLTPIMYWDSIAPEAMYSKKSVATALIKRSVVVFMSPLFFIFGAFWFLVYKNQRGHENNKIPLYQCSCNRIFVCGFYIIYRFICFI